MLRDIVEKTLFYRDGDKTFFEAEDFPWVARIETEWKSIRKELDALMVRREEIPNFQDVSKSQRALTEGDQWKTFYLWRQENRSELRKMPGDGATAAKYSGVEAVNVFHSGAAKAHPSTPRALKGIAALPPGIDDSRGGRQLQNPSRK